MVQLFKLSFRINCRYIFIGILYLALTTYGQLKWVKINPYTGDYGTNAIFFDGKQFIVAGNGGKVLKSSDGYKWSIINTATINSLYDIEYGNGMYVIVGEKGLILTSPDCSTWTQRFVNVSLYMKDIAFGNNTFVTISYLDSTVIYSSNGIDWKSTFIPMKDPSSITFGNGKFAIVGNKGSIMTSLDGKAWVTQVSGTIKDLTTIKYGNNRFVATGWSGGSLSSTDGVTWEKSTIDTAFEFDETEYCNGRFLSRAHIRTSSDRWITSTDGITWDTSYLSFPNEHVVLQSGNGLIAALGERERIYLSSDEKTWKNYTLYCAPYFTIVAYLNNEYVAGYTGTTKQLFTSQDGNTWSIELIDSMPGLGSVVYGNNRYVAVSGNGYILVSTDKKTWIPTFVDTSKWFDFIIYANGQFITFYKNKIYFSADGLNWEEKEIKISLTYLTYINDQYIACGAGGIIATSSDAHTWEVRYSDSTKDLNSLTLGNNMYVAVGASGTIVTSSDGISWTKHKSISYDNLSSVAFGEGYFAIVGGGYLNQIIATSTDGLDWIKKDPTDKNSDLQLNYIVYSNNQFLAVGDWGRIYTGRVLSTENNHGYVNDLKLKNKITIAIRGNFLSAVLPQNMINRPLKVSLFNCQGKQIYSSCQIPNSRNIKLSMDGISSGRYLLVVNDRLNKVSSIQINLLR